MSVYTSKADILRLLSDIEVRISAAEKTLTKAVKSCQAEAEEIRQERLARLEEEARELHVCIDDLFLPDRRKKDLPRACRIS
ncbi:DUF5446 family protein [Bacillus sp. L381]|uniref:DUF5446 family protein n=1 Tax=Bacillus TaxID=1386 RepID=UPI0005EE62A7|nr:MULTISPECIES: DUF5446 family protein [Bacillus]ASF29199.1 hypothetical protein WV34_10655 [Bacillus amyloliquefaciens]MCR9038591.1 DUF5446 family protein [Bacillus velezensis]MCZ4249045.1 DUF5446 family protein [Bacillus amyloliquefaciens]MDH3090487.1 DUF5446 family protein [Bacillus amyloliquefaciens]MDQ8091651.1 DUF5446 family protein [Bacillus amyloliquefaciens]